MKIYRNKPIQAGRMKSPMGRRIIHSNPLALGTKQGERITNQKMRENPFSMPLTKLKDTNAYRDADVFYFIDKNGQEIDIKESDYDKYVVDGYQGYSDGELEIRVHEKSDVKSSVRRNRRAISASNNTSVRADFQSFLGKVDRHISDALYQYDDAIWEVNGTISSSNDGYWFELNLYCDGEEAGTVDIEYIDGNFKTSTDAFVVTVSDSDEIQAEGNSFDSILDTCVGELIRLAEDYVNFVRIKY